MTDTTRLHDMAVRLRRVAHDLDSPTVLRLAGDLHSMAEHEPSVALLQLEEEEGMAWLELRNAEDECVQMDERVDAWVRHRRRREARDKYLSITRRLEALKTLTPSKKGVEL